MTLPVRQPTVKEACDVLKAAKTTQSRDACLRYWSERYGDEFVAMVKAMEEK